MNIMYWPDGTWVYTSEYNEAEYNYLGYDYMVTSVEESMEYEKIDTYIEGIINVKSSVFTSAMDELLGGKDE